MCTPPTDLGITSFQNSIGLTRLVESRFLQVQIFPKKDFN